MAMTYPYYTAKKTFYVYAFPFADTTGGGLVNGSWWKDCQLRIDSVNNLQMSGSIYLEITTARQGNDITAWNAGTSWGANQRSSYTLKIKCYDSANRLLGTVTPNECNKHIIYNVKASTGGSGKMYNWRNGINSSSTYEPWVVRYASDTGENVYTPVSTYTNTQAIFRYNNRTDSRVARTPINGGWQDFSVTLLAGTSYFGVDVECWAGDTLRRTETLYSATIEPIVIDTTSKLWRKPAGSSTWVRNISIWYRKANSSTWEKKYLYKRNASSTTWTRL